MIDKNWIKAMGLAVTIIACAVALTPQRLLGLYLGR